MSLCVISFTKNGIETSLKLKARLSSYDVILYSKKESNETSVYTVNEGISDWATKMMKEKHSLLFIGACGIAVRAIAPAINSKLTDSPVLVMDEKGQYIIPILSGHIGGANEIAGDISQAIGACPVITTATDINEKWAVDLWAKDNGLTIVNKDGIAKVSSKVLEGKKVSIGIDGDNTEAEAPVLITADPMETNTGALLYLKPKEYILGIGCKKGKEAGALEAFIYKTLDNASIDIKDVYALASIDLKKEEEAIVDFCRKNSIRFLTYSAKELEEVEGDFSTSLFVKEKTGVDNVCERAAIKAGGQGSMLVKNKEAMDGMTLAIAKRDWRANLSYE